MSYINVLLRGIESISLLLLLCYWMSLCLLGSPGLPQQWSSHVYGGFLWLSPGRSDSSAHRGTSYQKGNAAWFKRNVAWCNMVGIKVLGSIDSVTTLKGASLIAQTLKNLPAIQETWVGKIPWRRAWQPTPVFLPWKSHGQRSMAGYSPWGPKESDTTACLKHTPQNT